jgi:hypothetical protein
VKRLILRLLSVLAAGPAARDGPVIVTGFLSGQPVEQLQGLETPRVWCSVPYPEPVGAR